MAARGNLAGLRGFYAIVDPDHCGDRDPAWVAEKILQGGCAALQLHAKREPGDTRTLQLGDALAAMCRGHGVPFVVNDDPTLALRLGADALHLGQGDVPIERARELVGSMPIGLSTHNAAQARDAVARGADLIGFGPVFATSTKHNPDPVVGIESLQAICEAVPLPVVAIGGIDATSATRIAHTGVPLAAAISAVCTAEDPAHTARAIHTALRAR